MRLDSACKYTKNNANHNCQDLLEARARGWIPLANILKIMRITTKVTTSRSSPWLDSACKYTKNNANHNLSVEELRKLFGWIPLANILKIMRITTSRYLRNC